MTRELWINLPVKDVKKSKAFFAAIGFSFHPRHEHSDDMAGLVIGEQKTLVLLFPEATFQTFAQNELADTRRGTEVLFSVEAASREEVDDLVKKVREAGGTVFAEPQEQGGWMYGAGFADLDGHRWNVLYMDMAKAPQGF
ncbi:extradiol dioxygenase [Brevibacillus agri]|uniref:VOC family protein n=1 Tax=Brevibacillus TaxID=55080 RepID=UPI0002717630|nr:MULTISPECIES: VOC family protein [Brevibacillus]EJL46454.1 putative lactoylglutathione lyase [Brevibacillus sp. CF112]MBG9567380.1 extradiol dioxygenase [Brevibacillus agri]MCG5251654.1 extradiol dioxygenase [Brevibacillus agri]MED1644238.1 extradiol dioxygenase [Brevibacillus agri]MED1655506.1 extradiol dioxygenase [Brevibacillus agri]